MKRILAVFLCACFLAGCSSSIGNKANPAKASFQAGRTTKAQVAEYLGLPAKIDRAKDGKSEAWAYRKSPKVSGIMYAVPFVAGGQLMTQPMELSYSRKDLPSDIAAIYIFDNNGILTHVDRVNP